MALYVSYSFDDNHRASVSAAPILKRYEQVAGVTAPYIRDMGADWGALSWNDLKYLQNDMQWEVASHTLTHVALTEIPLNIADEKLTGWANVSGSVYSTQYVYNDAHVLDGNVFLERQWSFDDVFTKKGSFYLNPDNDTLYVHASSGGEPPATVHATSAEREIAQSKQIFADNGINVTSLVYPYGATNAPVENLVKAYEYSAATGGGYGANVFPPLDFYKIARYGATYAEGSDELTPAEAKQLLSQSAPNTWIVLNFHGLGWGENWTPSDLDDFASWVKEQGIKTVTFQDAVNGNPINHAPSAFSDAYTTNYNTQLTILPAGVLSNDTDVDGDALTALLKTAPQHGSLSLSADGGFVYQPYQNFSGVDQFTYAAYDGIAQSNSASVTLNVLASDFNVITGTQKNDTLAGTAGADKIDALAGNDRLSGNGGNDSLLGGSGKDTLNGGGGADTLDGGLGNDRLSGGADADQLVFGEVKDGIRQSDTITDFVKGTDKIVIKLAGGSYATNIIKVDGDTYGVDANANGRIETTEDLITASLGLTATDFLFS